MGINDNKIKIYCATGVEFSNALWATFMMGSFGTGLDWWWDRGVFDFAYHQEMKLLQAFIAKSSGIKNNRLEYKPSTSSDAFSTNKRKLDNYTLTAADQSELIGYAHFSPSYWRNEVYKNEDLKVLLENSSYNHPCIVGDQHDLNQEGKGDYQNKRFVDSYTGEAIPSLESPKITLKNLKSKVSYKISVFVKKNNALVLLQEKTEESNRNGKIKLILPTLNELNPNIYYLVQELK
jgi:ribosomal protein L31